MSATISGFESLRIEYGTTGSGKYRASHFFDVRRVPEYLGYAASIETFEHFGYVAVVWFAGESYSPHKIMFFPDRKWFEEWLEALEPKPEVLWRCGVKPKIGDSK